MPLFNLFIIILLLFIIIILFHFDLIANKGDLKTNKELLVVLPSLVSLFIKQLFNSLFYILKKQLGGSTIN